jgi:hypothetical protein
MAIALLVMHIVGLATFLPTALLYAINTIRRRHNTYVDKVRMVALRSTVIANAYEV